MLEDYTSFHSMLCKPDTARRCIQTFQDGVSLFAGQNDYDDALAGVREIANFDFNNIPFPLNVWTYYLLVLMSLTGFCSLMNCTKGIEVTECIHSFDIDSKNKPLKSELRFKKGDNKHLESSKTTTGTPLRLPPEALEYVIDRSTVLGPMPMKKEIKNQTNQIQSVSNETAVPELILIRRFEYDFGGYLSVMMLHFVCTNGRTHLVEVFRYNKGTLLGLVGSYLAQPLYIIKALLLQIRLWRQPVNDTKKTI